MWSRTFVAIGNDGTRAVVWGMGATVEAALREGRRYLADTTSPNEPLVTLEVPAHIAREVEAGDCSCAALDIDVTVRNGVITSAKLKSWP